jgi:hypothetical protein
LSLDGPTHPRFCLRAIHLQSQLQADKNRVFRRSLPKHRRGFVISTAVVSPIGREKENIHVHNPAEIEASKQAFAWLEASVARRVARNAYGAQYNLA